MANTEVSPRRSLDSSIPKRIDLYKQFASSQRWAAMCEYSLWALILLGVFLIDWNWAIQNWTVALVGLALVPMQMLPGILMIAFKKKKRIEDLSESARFGVFDKHILAKVASDVMNVLQIPKTKVNVFITGDKELNAFAVSLGVFRFLPQFRGVYLNRQTLHLMGPQELKSWIGHELGHLFPFALRIDQTIFSQIIAGSLLGLFTLQNLNGLEGYGFFIVLAVCWIFFYVLALPRSGMSQIVEYLCDEFGCKVAGPNAAVTDLLKAGCETSAYTHLAIHVMKLAREGRKISESDAFAVYESVLGYGPIDIERTRQRIHETMKQKQVANQSLSIKGLIDHMWKEPTSENEANDELGAEIELYDRLQSMPLIDWEEVTEWDGQSIMTDQQIQRLVDAIDASPESLLFPVTSEVNTGENKSHPSFRNRIIYLWKNREAIMKSDFDVGV